MKFTRSSNGGTTVKMTRSEWERYGKAAGWFKKKYGKNIGLVVLDGTPRGRRK
jgi:hypothetical protein